MEIGSSPRTVSSSKRIRYRASGWSVHEFEVSGGGAAWRCAVLGAADSVLVWAGGGYGARLAEAALGVPARAPGESARATHLLGDEAAAKPLATRLAALLSRPVYVCSGTTFDRFTLPLVERAIVTEIKSRPDLFL